MLVRESFLARMGREGIYGPTTHADHATIGLVRTSDDVSDNRLVSVPATCRPGSDTEGPIGPLPVRLRKGPNVTGISGGRLLSENPLGFLNTRRHATGCRGTAGSRHLHRGEELPSCKVRAIQLARSSANRVALIGLGDAASVTSCHFSATGNALPDCHG